MDQSINATEPSPSPQTYLNRGFRPAGISEEYLDKNWASSLAYDLHGLIETARYALENDTSGVAPDKRGISNTLEVAGYMLGDLIDACEILERAMEEQK